MEFLMKEIIFCFLGKAPTDGFIMKLQKNIITCDIIIPILHFILLLQVHLPGKEIKTSRRTCSDGKLLLHQNQMLYLFMNRKMKTLLNQEENGFSKSHQYGININPGFTESVNF